MDLDVLKKIKPTIIGHDNPDVDSISSGLLLEKLFKYLDIDAIFTICEESIEKTIQSVLNKFDIDISSRLNGRVSENLFLVDHHETRHKGHVIGAIDHHATIKKYSYFYYINEASSSTTLHIYNLMIKYNYPITEYEATLIVLGAYTDTCSLSSSKTRESDKVIIKRLIKEFNLDEKKFYKEGLLLRDLETMHINDIINNGLKVYTFGEHTIKSSYLRVGSISDLDLVSKELIRNITPHIRSTSITSWILIVVALYDSKTMEIHITNKDVQTFIHDGILSRGKDIMPKIELNLLTA